MDKKPKTFKFRTSTYIAPLVNVGDYWGPFEYERFWGSEVELHQEENNEIVCNDYDSEKFNRVQCEELDGIFAKEKPMEEIGVVAIKAIEPIIPRERNFMDNAVDIEVEVTTDFLGNVEKLVMDPANKAKVSEYIEENWKSRDGFASGMPAEDFSDLPQLFEDLRAAPNDEYHDEYRMWGSVLALGWLLTHDDVDEDGEEIWEGSLTQLLCEAMESNHSLGEFCTIIGRDEAYGLYRKHLIDFEPFRKKLDEDTEKYCASGVPKESQEVARRYRDRVLERVKHYSDWQDEYIADFHPDKKAVIKCLEENKAEWEAEREGEGEVKWESLWK